MNICLLVLGLAFGCSGTAAPDAAADAGPPAEADRWIAEDKLQHFALSFAATEMTYAGARFALDHDSAVPVAAGVALSLGLAKEFRDRRTGGRFSTRDLVWDAAGVALGVALIRSMR